MKRERERTRSVGLREALIAIQERAYGPGGRWHIPGHRYEFLEALAAGEPVVIDSVLVMSALSHMRLPCDAYGYGGRYWRKEFLLDEFDQLTELDA